MYMHLTATLPLYMYRSIGEGAHFSYIMGVHIICLIVFIPLLTGLIRDFDLFTILEIGCVVTSLSPVFLLLGSNYFTLGVFMAYCSIGESIYSPRLVRLYNCLCFRRKRSCLSWIGECA